MLLRAFVTKRKQLLRRKSSTYKNLNGPGPGEAGDGTVHMVDKGRMEI